MCKRWEGCYVQYKPKPFSTRDIELPGELMELSEQLAKTPTKYGRSAA